MLEMVTRRVKIEFYVDEFRDSADDLYSWKQLKELIESCIWEIPFLRVSPVNVGEADKMAKEKAAEEEAAD